MPTAEARLPTNGLDTLVRRVDEDRWLASRFAPAETRRRLIAVYALNYEIAHTAETVTQAALGDMRLAWWREAAERAAAGSAEEGHPALATFAQAAREARFSKAVLDTLVDARAKDLDADPFADWDELTAYLDATAGGVMRLAAEACGAHAPDELLRQAAIAWGCVGLVRAEPFWRARGRSVFPPGAGVGDMITRAREAYEKARGASIAQDAAPALAYVALTPLYLRALERGERAAPLLSRQLRLLRAVITGRL